jgi:hypothetical protein
LINRALNAKLSNSGRKLTGNARKNLARAIQVAHAINQARPANLEKNTSGMLANLTRARETYPNAFTPNTTKLVNSAIRTLKFRSNPLFEK